MSKSVVDESLDGWWLVDAIDGRRWVGRIVLMGPVDGDIPRLPLLDDEITLQPAFEMLPDRALVGMPTFAQQMNPKTMQLETVPALQSYAISWQQVAPIFNIEKNGTPPQRVRRCSLSRLSDWAPEARDGLYKGIKETLAKAVPAEKSRILTV
jgi:hypothetical protein